MKKIIGLILALIVALSVCSFAVITSATGDKETQGEGFEDSEGREIVNEDKATTPPAPATQSTPPANTQSEEPKPPAKTTPADAVADYISENKDGIAADLKGLFESVGLNADCFVEAVEGKTEVNINIVLTGVSLKEEERIGKIKSILEEASHNERLGEDFNFFNKQCADVHKVTVQFFTGEAMKDGQYDAKSASNAKIGEIALVY